MTQMPEDSSRKNILFTRHLSNFTGGHLKMAHYISHIKAHGGFNPILFTTGHNKEAAALYDSCGIPTARQLRSTDLYFVAGSDWIHLDRAHLDTRQAKVINLIQSFDHVDPRGKLYTYLARGALRICVSKALAGALERVPVNGPILTIENGVDSEFLATFDTSKSLTFLVVGVKNPVLARGVYETLEKFYDVRAITRPISRAIFLAELARAKIAVILPNPRGEGFSLPPLEAMCLDAAVVVPDCLGNRSYCEDRVNCLMPEYTLPEITASAIHLAEHTSFARALRNNARTTCCTYSLKRERAAVQSLMTRVLELPSPIDSSVSVWT